MHMGRDHIWYWEEHNVNDQMAHQELMLSDNPCCFYCELAHLDVPAPSATLTMPTSQNQMQNLMGVG